MKLSLNELLPYWVTDFYDFLAWINDDFGISTSGLRSGLLILRWFKAIIRHNTALRYSSRIAIPPEWQWGHWNAYTSHLARPWRYYEQDEEFTF